MSEQQAAEKAYKQAIQEHRQAWDNFWNADPMFCDLAIDELNAAALRVKNARTRLQLLGEVMAG